MRPHRYPYEQVLGKGKLIKGWEAALAGVAVGETVVLVVSPDYGYGAAGSAGKTAQDTIPPNATLKFTIEMVGITVSVKVRGRVAAVAQDHHRALRTAGSGTL